MQQKVVIYCPDLFGTTTPKARLKVNPQVDFLVNPREVGQF